MTPAFPAMPSHSQSRDGRQIRTAGQISWAHEITRKKAPYSAYSSKCSNTTAKWMAAAPTESDARPPRRYGRIVGGLVPASLSSRTRVLIPPRLSSQSLGRHRPTGRFRATSQDVRRAGERSYERPALRSLGRGAHRVLRVRVSRAPRARASRAGDPEEVGLSAEAYLRLVRAGCSPSPPAGWGASAPSRALAGCGRWTTAGRSRRSDREGRRSPPAPTRPAGPAAG